MAIAVVEVQVLSSALRRAGPGGPALRKRLFRRRRCESACALTPSGRIPTLRDEHTFANPSEATRAGRDPLTARQQEIWQFLVEYVDGHGYPPTVREIGEEVGLASPSTVHAHLANLERVGLIRRDPTKPRAIELTGHRRVEAPAASDVPPPLLGRVAAGGPLLAEENVEDVVAVPEAIGRGPTSCSRSTATR